MILLFTIFVGMNSLAQSKLIDVLKVLSPSELRQFRLFMESGLSPIGAKVLILYDFLSQHYPVFSNAAMTRQSAFKSMYPESAFEDKKLRYAMTDLYQHLCKFLAFKSVQENTQLYSRVVKEELVRRGADKAYLSLLSTDGQNWEADAPGTADQYFERYNSAFVHLNHFHPRQKRTAKHPIGHVALNLDRFYVTRKLQLLCEIVNVRNVIAVNYDFLLHEEIVNLISNDAFRNVPSITIYYRVLMTLTDPEQELHFVELEKQLQKYGTIFTRDELRDLYQYLMNYCIKKINLGNTTYLNRLLEIYRLLLRQKIIFSGDYLSQWDYKNIVTIGLRCEEYDWVQSFIETYKETIPLNERENAFRFNLANFYFSRGEFKPALSLLQQVEFTDLYYQLDSRAILLKCYFEMDDEEALFYHIAAFKLFLNRNKKISEYQSTIYRNLIKYTARLMKDSGNRKKMSELQKEIDEVKQIADINWIKKKFLLKSQ